MNADPDPHREHASAPHAESGPGALHGEVWLTIQTYQAQSLIHGRRATEGKSAITGLIGFADRLKSLWQAVRFNDPYADWWLLKVEAEVADTRARLQALQQRVNALIQNASSALEFSVAQSSRPQKVSLQFANPYAFRGAQLLGEYDRLMCAEMTLHHVGIELPGDLVEQLSGSGRWVRRVFALPQGYHALDICRADVRQGTAAAMRAQERMGDIPPDILNGERLPSLRPVPFRGQDSQAVGGEGE